MTIEEQLKKQIDFMSVEELKAALIKTKIGKTKAAGSKQKVQVAALPTNHAQRQAWLAQHNNPQRVYSDLREYAKVESPQRVVGVAMQTCTHKIRVRDKSVALMVKGEQAMVEVVCQRCGARIEKWFSLKRVR